MDGGAGRVVALVHAQDAPALRLLRHGGRKGGGAHQDTGKSEGRRKQGGGSSQHVVILPLAGGICGAACGGA